MPGRVSPPRPKAHRTGCPLLRGARAISLEGFHDPDSITGYHRRCLQLGSVADLLLCHCAAGSKARRDHYPLERYCLPVPRQEASCKSGGPAGAVLRASQASAGLYLKPTDHLLEEVVHVLPLTSLRITIPLVNEDNFRFAR